MNYANSIGPEKLYEVCVLREQIRPVAGRTARYRFCVLRFAGEEYYAEILLGEERAAAQLSLERAPAERLFDALVAGSVTPCTLIDVVTDAKNSPDSPLQKGNFVL
ncbi:MAG: hypothetical protein J6U87_00840 [Clostridia bacterium]|nr:hypothetical protein [Clostridia bacterium]